MLYIGHLIRMSYMGYLSKLILCGTSLQISGVSHGEFYLPSEGEGFM